MKRISWIVFFIGAVVMGCSGNPGAFAVDVTGTWTGALPIGDGSRMFTFQLHRRSGGTVMGYVVGGSAYRTVVAGSLSGPFT